VNTTKAVRIERYGAPGVLVDREIPLPDPGPDEVHVEVEAAGVNFADLAMRAGIYATAPKPPFSPGFEIAGTVARVGTDVHDWRTGERVVALVRHGGYARDIIVPVRNLVRRPASLSPAEAAAVPVAFLTGWVALFESGRVRDGETALILGAAGGVGTAATQLAVRAGLRVIGTAGTAAKREFVTHQLGAAACFDSRGDWETEVRAFAGNRGIDVALDPIGGEATSACRRLLAPLGRIVFYGLSDALPGSKRNWFRIVRAYLRTPRIHPLSLVEANAGVLGIHLLHLAQKETVLLSALEEIHRGIAAGELRPILDRTFPLDAAGAAAAHTFLHERRNLGKVVLTRAATTRVPGDGR
jgi:NADPH2:quinone reductase